MSPQHKHSPGHHHAPGAAHDAPTVGSTAAILNIRADGRDGVELVPPNPHFERIGGEAPIRALVERFYHHMNTLPEAQTIRAMHPQDLSDVKEVLFKFLVGWMGGPQLYAAERGQPRLRRKHMPFAIGDAERDAWMACMHLAMEDTLHDEALKSQLTEAFYKTANFLRNL